MVNKQFFFRYATKQNFRLEMILDWWVDLELLSYCLLDLRLEQVSKMLRKYSTEIRGVSISLYMNMNLNSYQLNCSVKHMANSQQPPVL